VFAFHAAASDSGLFGVYAGTGEREVAELLPLVCDELGEVARTLEEPELARARAQIKAGILMGRESTTGRCEQLANQLQIYGRPLPTDEIVREIEAVDAPRLRDLAQRLAGGTPTLTSLGPVAQVEPFDRVARRFAA
jgi:predicted Zn-dependent peptidase